jgi:hypothetical protein
MSARALWEPGQPVAAIYGAPASTKARVVLPDEGRLFRPEQDRTLVLMKVDKQRGDNPLQVKTVRFLAARTAYGLGAFGALALLGNGCWGGAVGDPIPNWSTAQPDPAVEDGRSSVGVVLHRHRGSQIQGLDVPAASDLEALGRRAGHQRLQL